MLVHEVMAATRTWIIDHCDSFPGFVGAHAMGALATMDPDDPFPSYRDVDFNIVVRHPEHLPATRDVDYNGLILEYTTVSWDHYASPEVILPNPALAPNLAHSSILVDPHHSLEPLQRAVAHAFAHRRWVTARYENAKQAVRTEEAEFVQVASPIAAIYPLTWTILHLSGALAAMQLRPPTHRRALVVLHDILATHHALELHEAILDLLGYRQMTQAQVEYYLSQCARAFDQAVAVRRTPATLDFKFHAHVRPYIIEGAHEMIMEGYHREAMIWIMGFLLLAHTIIQNDAPTPEKAAYEPVLQHLFVEMGVTKPNYLETQRRKGPAVVNTVLALGDELVTINAAIQD